MHDARLYLVLPVGYSELLCRPDFSPGFLCSRLGNLKWRRRNLWWAMSINSDCANFLVTNCLQELPENELEIVSATKECTSVEPEDRVMETNSKAAVRGLFLISYPPISLIYIWIQESSNNPREVVPSTAKYIMATGKQALKVLQSAAAFIPVPLIREAVGVALKIIEVCEEQCEVCKIPLRKGCKTVNNILSLEYIHRRSKGPRAER